MNNGTTRKRTKPQENENFKENGYANNETMQEEDDFGGNYIDSESANVADSLTKILNVPTETIQADKTTETREDVLSGFGGSGGQNFNAEDGAKFKSSGYAQEEFDSGFQEEALFEDNELLAQIGVELIDMLMTYGAMAISKDWDNEEKYAIKDKRKKRLEAPLQKILENRQVKTAPELVFAFMLIVTYSPMMVMAVQERRRKKKESVAGPVKNSEPVVRQMVVKQPIAEATILNEEEEAESNGWKDMGVEVAPETEDPMGEFLSQMQPKRRQGRPKGSTDIALRSSLDGVEREKAIEKAKAFRKDGWSFNRIAKHMNVSVGTAMRWCRS
jgi:hypothetical protein